MRNKTVAESLLCPKIAKTQKNASCRWARNGQPIPNYILTYSQLEALTVGGVLAASSQLLGNTPVLSWRSGEAILLRGVPARAKPTDAPLSCTWRSITSEQGRKASGQVVAWSLCLP